MLININGIRHSIVFSSLRTAADDDIVAGDDILCMKNTLLGILSIPMGIGFVVIIEPVVLN